MALHWAWYVASYGFTLGVVSGRAWFYDGHRSFLPSILPSFAVLRATFRRRQALMALVERESEFVYFCLFVERESEFVYFCLFVERESEFVYFCLFVERACGVFFVCFFFCF